MLYIIFGLIVLVILIGPWIWGMLNEGTWQRQKELAKENTDMKRKLANIEQRCPKCGKEKTISSICDCGYEFEEGERCVSCGDFHPYKNLVRVSSWDDKKGMRCKGCEVLDKRMTERSEMYPEARHPQEDENKTVYKYKMSNGKSTVLATEKNLEIWLSKGYKIISTQEESR